VAYNGPGVCEVGLKKGHIRTKRRPVTPEITRAINGDVSSTAPFLQHTGATPGKPHFGKHHVRRSLPVKCEVAQT